MTIVDLDGPGIAALAGRLDRGAPVVVPLPSPLPNVVVGTDPGAVNAAKGRPREQPVGAGIWTLDVIGPAIELDRETTDLARWLLFTEQASVLIPVGAAAPDWLTPAIVDRMAFLGGAWLPELSALADGRTHVAGLPHIW